MPLNIRIQWKAGTACVSECVLKTLWRVGVCVSALLSAPMKGPPIHPHCDWRTLRSSPSPSLSTIPLPLPPPPPLALIWMLREGAAQAGVGGGGSRSQGVGRGSPLQAALGADPYLGALKRRTLNTILQKKKCMPEKLDRGIIFGHGMEYMT